MDRESIDRLERAILLEPNVDRLRELALLAIEGWNKAHQTLEGIQGIVAAAEGK